MFFVPEPIRNETNRLAQEELKAQAEQQMENFNNLPRMDDNQSSEVPVFVDGEPTAG